MVASQNRSRWAYDPNWIRIEHVDSAGDSLGYTEFERATAPLPNATKSRTGSRASGRRFDIATICRVPEFLLWLLGGLFGAATANMGSWKRDLRFAFAVKRLPKRGS